ncbi:hypothetical protein [Antrihabitans cavernicola]|uniref:PspA domain-containing protein n=1 Tax=Antrihabitans cavernicola TaxID=2495913 RepID=A0A5A7S7I3_9NOCA|nr:hypothetical protein [Spelaeibacter cavernicola]KAA0021102.1 hypothetical protein FOY51_21025 [Spelaeibacter cavernicola]
MPDTDLTARLRALPDREFLDVVKAASADRPGLGAVHAAAAAEGAGSAAEPTTPPVPEIPPVPGLPSTPDLPTTTDVPPPIQMSAPAPDYTAGGVPTFDRVRDKVEQRYGTALGSDELDRATPAGRSIAEQWDAREKAGHEKLDQIRKSMHASGEQSTAESKENE